MTLRIIDGLDWLPTGQSSATILNIMNANQYYNSQFNATVATGRFDFGQSILYNSFTNWVTQQDFFILPSGVNATTGFMGMALRVWGDDSSHHFVGFFDSASNVPQFTVHFAPNGIIQVYRGFPSGGAFIGQTSPGCYIYGSWFYLEIGATIGSGGRVRLRVNTQLVLDLNPCNCQNSANSFTDSIAYGVQSSFPFSTTVHIQFDDIYFCDDQGSVNNSFLGNCRVWTQFTTGNGPHIDFTIGGSSPAPTNWQSVQNKLINDSQFVFSGATGAYDLYTLQAIVNSPSIFGVQVKGAYRQDTATQLTAHNVIKSGATQVEGVDHLTNQNYVFYKDLWETDPNTGVGFLDTAVNALLIGPKRVSP